MEQINFNHQYEKMPFIHSGDKTVLLEVFNTSKEDLSYFFIDYDTKVRGKDVYYALPDGELLVLLLRTSHSYPGLPNGHEVEIVVG